MTIKVLNLRSFISGQQPVSLEGGELCFNMTDRTLFVGNQSDSKTDFNGNSSSGVPGQGWFSMPMDAAGFGEYFLTSPDVYGQLPNNGDTLEWNSLLGHLEWVPGGGSGGGSSAGYLTTNSDVVAAPGANITAKLNSIISPSVALSGNTAIVQGVSGDLYEGVYTFVDDTWEFGSFYAQPVAAAIVYDNAVSGLSSGDVQGAIDELAAGKVNTPLTPPLTNQVLGWNGAGTEWVSSSGGTVTGVFGVAPIVIDDTDPLAPVVEVSAATTSSSGVVRLNNTTTSTSTTEAATANAVKIAYDLANTAEADAQQALADAAAATSIANTAEADAQLALSDAASAQSDATLAIGLANIAEADAQQALIDAAAAQNTADLALPLAGGNMSGIINFAGTQPTATILAANIVRLLDSTSSNSITTAATPNSVRAAYSLANGALPKVGGVMTGDITFHNTQQFPVSGIQGGSTTQTGVVQLLSSVSSISQSYAATPYAVKLAYDAAVAAQTTANAALSRTGGTMTGNIVFAPTQTFPSSSVADATTTSKGVVQIGTNIEVSSGIISVLDGNTTEKGVVQLTDALNSTSTTLGLTASGGYLLQQQIDTLSLLSNLTFCGTINASTGLLTSVTDAGIAHGFTVGLPLPLPGLVTNDHFVVVSIPGTFTPPGGSGPVVCNQGDWIVGTEPTPAAYEWSLQPVGYDAPSATTTVEGVTYLATNLEVQTGTDTSNKAVNPASLQSKLSDSVSLTSSTTIASSTAVKEAYDLADAAIPNSVFDAAGDMVVATGADTYTRFAVGADGYILSANSSQANGVEWVPAPTGPGSAQSGVEGLVYGLTANSVSGYNVSLGYGANGTLTTGVGNVAIGGASGDMTSGSYNVAIGFDVNVSNPTFDKQLAIGPDAYTRWLTGDSSMNVKLGAGLVDALDSIGTSGQILSSTGTALQWINNTPDGVLGVTGTTPISVDNTDPQNPVVSVDAGTTLATGVVQLEDSVSSVSTTTAATPNSVKTAYDLADAAVPDSTYTALGDLVAGTGASTYVVLPRGTDDQVLAADSTAASGLKWVSNTDGSVIGVTGTSPITVDNTDPQNPVISVDAGTTLVAGVLQLTDSVASTSTTTAATPNSVKAAYDFASTMLPKAGGTMSGDITLDAALVDGLGSPGVSGYILSSTLSGVQWVTNSTGEVVSVTGTAPITIDNTDPANPVIGVSDATSSSKGVVEVGANLNVSSGVINVASGSTTVPGILQLVDGISSTSITTAATPNSVKTAYDLANAALPKAGGTMSGDITLDAALVDGVGSPGTSGYILSSTATGVAWVANSADGVLGVTGTTPITVDNTDPANPVVGVDAGTTIATGVVQLEDSVSSTSITTAATPNSVKTAYDLANAALPKAGGAMSGDITLDAALVDGVGSPGTSGYILSSTVTGVEWVSNTADGVLGVTGTTPITVDNVDPANPVIGVDSGSLIAEGVLQLTDSTSSTSTTTAATPNSVKTAYDLADAAVPDSTYTALGDLVAGTGAGVYVVLPRGADDQVLAVDSATLSGLKWVSNTAGSVVGVTGTSPITVDNTDPQNPVVEVNAGSTTASGVVQLEDSVSSISTTTAATPNSVKTAYDLATTMLPKAGGTMSGDIILDAALVDGVGSPGTSGYILSSTVTGVEWVSNTADGVLGVTGNAPITVDNVDPANPVISVNTATTSALGAVQVGTNVDIAAGVISVKTGSATDLGVLQVGSNVDVAAGVISVKTANLTDLGVVQIGTNIDVAAGVISVADASTSTKGVVQLNNTTNNTSTSLALTAAQGKNLQDQIDALVISSNITLAGTFNASTGLVDSVTAAGTVAGFVVGNALPTPAAGNAEHFVIVDVTGSTGPTGTPPYHVGDWFLSNGTAWEFLNVGFQAPAATTTVEGVVYLATGAEVQAGTDTSNKAVNPASLQSKVSDSVSTTDSYSIASSTAVKTAYDLANAAIPGSVFNTKGDIVVGTGNDTYGNFPSGTNGQILTVDSAETFGVKWVNNSADGVVGVTGTTPITVNNTDPVNPVIGVNVGSTTATGVLQLTNSVSSTSTSTAATPASVKTAYDLANAALPVNAFDAKGDTLVGTGSDSYTRLPVGSNNSVLTADSATASGVKWSSAFVTSVTSEAGSPIQVNNTNPQVPVLSVVNATISSYGVTQLFNGVGSTSNSFAATPNSVKTAYDLALSKVSGPTAFQTAGQSLVVNNPALGTTSWGWRVNYLDSSGPITIGGTALVPIVGINSATTTSPGAVQLNDSTISTSATQALTANQGRVLQEQIDALAVSSNLTFAGTVDASTGNMSTVSAAGSLKGFTVGSPLPSPAVGNTEYFTIVTVPGTMTPPGGSAQLCHQGDWWLSNGTAWNFLDIGYNAAYATTTAPGVIQLATDAEVQAGLNTDYAVVPSSLQSKISDSVITTSSTTIASSTAVKAAYDLADGALQKGGGTMTGTLGIATGVSLTLDTGSTLSANGAADLFGASTFYNGPVNFGTTSVTFQNDTTVNLDGTTNFVTGSVVNIDGDFVFSTSPTWTSTSIVIGAAVQITYDNTTSGLVATEVQAAIDELAADVLGFIPDSAFAAKGDLLAGTGASAYSAVTVGTDGQVLIADSASAAGVSWSDVTIPGLGTPSTVAAADQLGLVYDLSDGKIKSVVAFDAGAF